MSHAACWLAGALLLAAVSSQAAHAQQGDRASQYTAASELMGSDLADARGEALGGAAKEARAVSPPQWPAMRASALQGKEVVDRDHRDFGESRDLLVDLQGGRVAAALVDRRDDWAPGQALVRVPIAAFSLPRDLPDKLAINYSRERFE